MVYIWGPDLYCKSTIYYQNIQNRVRISRQNSIFFYNIFLINTIARLLVSVIMDSAVISNQRGYLNLQLCSRLVRIEI